MYQKILVPLDESALAECVLPHVKAIAKDVEDSISKWTTYPIRMDVPDINIISLQGGLFKIRVTFPNDGLVEAEDINWKISIEGGIVLLGRESTGTIDYLGPGEKETIQSKIIIGFGDIEVKVNIDGTECSTSKQRGGQLWGIYIKMNAGGE